MRGDADTPLVADLGLVRIDGGFHVKALDDQRCVDVMRMLFNWRVVVSDRDHQFIEHAWCYFGTGVDTFTAAVLAAHAWDGTGSPAGFDKQAY